MYKNIWFALIAVIATSCASKQTFLNKRENELGTNGKNRWVFHRLSDRDKGTSLAFDGYIIGIEKASRKRVGAPSKKKVKRGNGLDIYDFNQENTWANMQKRKRRLLDDKKPMFISTIHEFEVENEGVEHIRINPIYDAYDTLDLVDPKKAFEMGKKHLEELEDSFISKIDKVKPTHVFVYSMGWNSDQQEAIRNFNSMFLKIISEANKSEKEFRPIFFGITWPSMWSEKWWSVFSFFNKTNDADEVGMTWANHILNKIILKEEVDHTFETVVVGHSFGAKLTSRATMSASMLKENSKKVNLLINLQSAYSINRYSDDEGIEKTKDYENWNQYAEDIVLVCSRHDKAVKKGIYAPFAGGIKAYKKVMNDKKGYYDNINHKEYFADPPTTFSSDPELIIINASSIIMREAHQKGGKAHSDIYNKEVAQLLWQLIETKTYD